MANSINTNAGALVALQNLNATSRELGQVQNRINTGQRISSAKDNGAVWAVAQGLRGDMRGLDAVKNSIQRARSVADVGLAAGESIMDALKEMKELAVAIEAGTADGSDVTAYQSDFASLQAEITATGKTAKFDGTDAFAANAGSVRIGLAATEVADVGVAFTPTAAIPETVVGVDAAIDATATAMQTLGTQAKSLERASVFVTKFQDAVETGIGNLVDADLAKESARLQSLQTKQQLGVQALSIANQSSGILLGLFR
ncbi:flagellin [Caulobacter sp. 17J65-9]|uniref:flagellin n=1 Tax=Caulobacter sp. 17J65-9 TaxID=2709382 RepID=UPI0013C769DA|nr:flagellin [Caulobacter sp. 17J65-9]NEX93692.1 flagellin [Caulobacter sp. 17J65-9]